MSTHTGMVKPGWRTTEFWVTLATLAVQILAAVRPGAVDTVTAVASAVAALGYGASRAHVKASASAPAGVAVPTVSVPPPPPPGWMSSSRP